MHTPYISGIIKEKKRRQKGFTKHFLKIDVYKRQGSLAGSALIIIVKSTFSLTEKDVYKRQI